MADSYDVFGVGNALVDVLALVDDDFVASYGLGKGSMTLVDAAQQAALLDELEGRELKLRSGGSAANTMVAVAQSGGSGFYVGKVARDNHGRFYRQDMIDSGVHFDVHPTQDGGPTGTSLILTTPDTERTMCTNLGVSIELDKDDIDVDRLSRAKFAYIEGYLWDGEKPRAASTHAMECAKSKGIPISFTFSDMFLVDRFGDDFKRITHEYCDVVFCNADEIRHFFGLKALEACATELGKIVETAFVTDGPRGCYVAHNGQIQHVAGFAAQAVDTVGAGDAFAGGVLFGLSNGWDYAEAARWGNYVASRVVQIYGARLDASLVDQVDFVLGR